MGWEGGQKGQSQALSRKRHLSRVGPAGSSGKKVTVRPRSAQEESGRGAEVAARWVGYGAVPQPWPGLSGKAEPLMESRLRARASAQEQTRRLHCPPGRWPGLAHSGAPILPFAPTLTLVAVEGGGTPSFFRTFPEDHGEASPAGGTARVATGQAGLYQLGVPLPFLLPTEGQGSP